MDNKIHACIWCNNNAKEMADFYCNTFTGVKVIAENPVVVMIAIEGQNIMLLNGGDKFKPGPAISYMGVFNNAGEIKNLWDKLTDGGKALMELGPYPWSEQYGWVEDRYGVNWQLYKGSTGGAKEKYVPTLMFTGNNNGKAKEAIEFYTKVFPASNVQGIMEYSGAEGEQKGNVQHAQFDINGFTLMCMDSSAPHPFNFTEGNSLVVNCKDQEEIDHYWNNLTAHGGREGMCGWLKDKYGVSWQIVPDNTGELLSKSPKVGEALMKMKKLVISDLENAAKS